MYYAIYQALCLQLNAGKRELIRGALNQLKHERRRNRSARMARHDYLREMLKHHEDFKELEQHVMTGAIGYGHELDA